jgi:hypothetical protein
MHDYTQKEWPRLLEVMVVNLIIRPLILVSYPYMRCRYVWLPRWRHGKDELRSASTPT